MEDSTRIIDLTVADLQLLIAKEVAKVQPATVVSDGDGWCRGLQEFADFLGCSLGTANKIKSSGKIDDAVVQVGRMIMINKAKSLDLLHFKKV